MTRILSALRIPVPAPVRTLAKTAVGGAGASLDAVARRVEAGIWKATRYRPRFNLATLAERLPAAAGGDDATGGRLVVRVAFHYVPWRLKYLKETVDALNALPFRSVDVFVDTNSAAFAAEASRYLTKARVEVWTDLEHPFKLTWVHRRALAAQAGDYDTFAYVEDDIAIPASTMRRWLVETERLRPHGFLPGFLRVEEDRSGRLVLSDFLKPVSRANIVEVGGRPYLDSPYPYQACWILDRPEFEDFLSRPSWSGGTTGPRGKLGLREQVAVGPAYDAVPPGRRSRLLVPLDGAGEVAPDTVVAHVPSNYGRLRAAHPAGLGRVRLDSLFAD